MRERNQGDVSPKAGILGHLFRFGFCGDADLRNLRASQCVHQGNQFLHGQFAIGPNHDRHIRIGLLQLNELRRERFQVHRLIVKPDRLAAVDRKSLHLRRIDRLIGGAAGWDHQVHAVFEQRRRDHENDQQHESEIEQGRDIDLA